MTKAKTKGLVWVIAVIITAIALPLWFDIDVTSFNVRLSITSSILMLVTYTAWIKTKVDRLQESESLDEDDEEFLFYATSQLQAQVWTLMVIYFVTFLSIFAFMVIGEDGRIGAIVYGITYLLFVLSVLLAPALRNIDLAVSREVHARKKAKHVRSERADQRERISSADELPKDVSERIRRHNKVINGDS